MMKVAYAKNRRAAPVYSRELHEQISDINIESRRYWLVVAFPGPSGTVSTAQPASERSQPLPFLQLDITRY